MKVVLDSNIFFSALISPTGYSNHIYRAWKSGRFNLVTSSHQLEEIRRASRYPKLRSILQPDKVGTMLNNLRNALVLRKLRLKSIQIDIDDPDDKFLIAMVLDANVDYLVTGDQKAGLLKLGKIGKAKVLTPILFCKKVLQ